jgi:hypothetical protein
MARRRHKRNPKAKYKVRHVVLKKNPRRHRRNPAGDPASVAADKALGDIAKLEGARSEPMGLGRPGRGFKSEWAKNIRMVEAKQRKRAARALRSAAKAAGKSAKKAKGVTKQARGAQASRLRALAAVVEKQGRTKAMRSPLVKAMTIKSNPGMAGVIQSAKILAPVALVGAGGLVGLAMAGRKLSDMLIYEAPAKDAAADAPRQLKKSLVDEKTGAPTMLAQYAPALSTAALSAVAYVVADKVAPRYKGAIAIGGMLGAIVQAVGAAAMTAKPESLLAKAKSALSLGEYTTVGAGIFHGFGEYTTVGNAHPFRPRNFADNTTEFAPMGAFPAERSIPASGGADNLTEFAPGEGGIFAKIPAMAR